MRKLYQAILSLYPAEYRALFALEMLAVFEEASTHFRKRGLLDFVRFTICEYIGLLKGVIVEHTARWAAQDTYITSCCALSRTAADRGEIVEIEHHLEQLVRSMEFAIAHHDFPKARLYSKEERITRARLQLIVDKQQTE